MKYYKDKKSCKDVFNASLLANAEYAGHLEIPIVNATQEIPTGLIPFSKIRSSTEYNKWVHFYVYDDIIERIWKHPHSYLPYLQKFKGAIMPDFSLFRDFPLTMQINNIFRSRVIGQWLQKNGVNSIPNIRFGDDRTFKISCIGVPSNSTIAVGTHGTMKYCDDREILEDGLAYVLNRLHPSCLVVYGTVSEVIRNLCDAYNTKLVVFESDYSQSHSLKKGVN